MKRASPSAAAAPLLRRTARRRQAGFSLLEFALVLGLFLVALAYFLPMQIDQDRQLYDKILADQTRQLFNAGESYLKANAPAVEAAIAAGPLQVTVAQLINANLLPPGFAAKNVLGQQPYILFAQRPAVPPVPGVQPLIEMVATAQGGGRLADFRATRAASLLSGIGGFVPANPPPGNANCAAAAAVGCIYGAGGGFTVDLTIYAGPAPAPNLDPGPGHIAAVNWYDPTTLPSNLQLVSVQEVADGATVPIPANCPAGTAPNIFLAASNIGAPNTGVNPPAAQLFEQVETWADKAPPNWVVHMRVLTETNGLVAPALPWGAMQATVVCQ